MKVLLSGIIVLLSLNTFAGGGGGGYVEYFALMDTMAAVGLSCRYIPEKGRHGRTVDSSVKIQGCGVGINYLEISSYSEYYESDDHLVELKVFNPTIQTLASYFQHSGHVCRAETASSFICKKNISSLRLETLSPGVTKIEHIW